MATIKLTNSVTVHSESLKVHPDYTNVIATYTFAKGSEGPYTVGQDCYLNVTGCEGHTSLKVNDVNVSGFVTSGNYDAEIYARFMLLKKGDVLKKQSYYGLNNENDGALTIKLWGTK